MEKVTLEQIEATPATEYISTQSYNYKDFTMYCPFCGERLRKHTEGWGRDKMEWYDDCTCEGAQKAQEHNTRARELKTKQQAAAKSVLHQNSPAETVNVSTSRRGNISFNEVVAILQRENLYVSHTTFGEPVDIDGIMIGYMFDMHKKIVVIDDNTTFQSYNWDLCISFISENNSQNPIMNVVRALGNCGRPYQHVVVTDVKKASEILKNLF